MTIRLTSPRIRVRTVSVRQRNPRGEGGRLREDLLAGAQRNLERTGSEDRPTLRAMAREVGISAPSIYAHFPDSQANIHAPTQQAARRRGLPSFALHTPIRRPLIAAD